jgi:uncharacterized repeat protein (TIGR01451 family)
MRFLRGGAGSGALNSKTALVALAAASAGVTAAPASAAGTPAGTNIDNVATATWELPSGGQTSIDSNIVTLKVDELLDVTVASTDPGDVGTQPGLVAQLLGFTITNAGNGIEKFGLSTVANGGGDDFDPAVTAVYLDANGNGAFDAGLDTLYVAGTNDPELDPDESLAIFVLSTIPLAAGDGDRGKVDLAAVAKTGSGAPGTSFDGLGQGGGDAVVGATGADGDDDGFYRVSAATLAFVKTAVVADPFGGSTQVPGATITYTLAATVGGSGSLANLRISDPVPAGSTYTAASITLDGATLTDAADADAGSFSGSSISVGLGTVAAGTTRTVTFKVRID